MRVRLHNGGKGEWVVDVRYVRLTSPNNVYPWTEGDVSICVSGNQVKVDDLPDLPVLYVEKAVRPK